MPDITEETVHNGVADVHRFTFLHKGMGYQFDYDAMLYSKEQARDQVHALIPSLPL